MQRGGRRAWLAGGGAGDVWDCARKWCAALQALQGRAVLKGGKKRFVTPTETNVHGDGLCFMVKTWAGHKTTEASLNNGWRLAAVGGGWQLAAVGGGWQLAAVGGGWQLAAVGGWRSLGAVLRGYP